MLWKLVKEKVSTEVFVHPCTRHLPMYFLNDKWTLAMYLAVGDRAVTRKLFKGAVATTLSAKHMGIRIITFSVSDWHSWIY